VTCCTLEAAWKQQNAEKRSRAPAEDLRADISRRVKRQAPVDGNIRRLPYKQEVACSSKAPPTTADHHQRLGREEGVDLHILRIEHPVPDFQTWKDAFDSDPVDREGSGVRSYRVLRQVDDPNYVLIDLEFESAREAEAMLAKLRDLWARVDVMRDPQVTIVEAVESREY
jgi:hypothetical protein